MKLIPVLLGSLLCLPAFGAQGILAPGAKPIKVSGDFAFTEGPAADRDGNIYFTDQPNDRIVRWNVDGTISDWLKPAGRSNGTYFDRDGNLLTCADGNNELWSISPDKKVTVLLRDFEGKLLNGPNDLWITPEGDIYFTDPLYPRNYWKRSHERQQPGEYVYLLERKSGRVRVVDHEITKPNGIIGTPDGKTLYVADIGANKTYSYDIAADGSLTGKKLFCSLGSDGMTIDAEGNVYLTGNGVTVFNRSGQQIEHIAISEPWTANVTFGGRDRRTLFITASRAIYTVAMRVQGAQ
ncbi:MAG TPA: SMP-30/gluconolactonase/LRE family protein [Lacunisphaera sp.]|nr:SMP-30/gluconolactonase/LRE family protein [Lacunisphaera sp.]